MSGDLIYLACMRSGEPHRFERKLAEEIIHRGRVDGEPPQYFDIRYSDGGTNVSLEDSETVDGVSFSNWCGPTFFDRVWELADRTGSMIGWIGWGIPRAVTRPDMLQHLPKELENEEPEPFVILNGRELAEIIVSTS